VGVCVNVGVNVKVLVGVRVGVALEVNSGSRQTGIESARADGSRVSPY
jgi:hypothetical protein